MNDKNNIPFRIAVIDIVVGLVMIAAFVVMALVGNKTSWLLLVVGVLLALLGVVMARATRPRDN
ncbi:MAG: hypothetical protein LC131_15425 [Anaerolineae bacterium]|nr:hypothetical protein [Anaerolineae bacterium]